MEKVTWKNIFHTNHTKAWGFITRAESAAKKAAYPYFSWNGNIIETSTGKTVMLEEEVDKTLEKQS